MYDKVYYFPAFLNGQKHGGNKRSIQIFEYLKLKYKNMEVIELSHPVELKRVVTILKMLRYIVFNYELRYSLVENLKLSLSYVFLARVLAKSEQSNVKIILEQAPGWTMYHSKFISESNISFDLYPHNIEFCVSGQNFRDDGLMYSIVRDSFVKASHIYTISEFDNNITRIFNKNSDVFEFRNPPKDQLFFSKIKLDRARRSTSGGKLVIIGSVVNPPSKLGIIELIRKINEDEEFFAHEKFILGGFNTEILRDFSSHRLDVLGSLDQSQLYEVLVNAKAIVINQYPTTGWLTRITDMIDAGIPIYINSTYFQTKLIQLEGMDITYFDLS